ncbi:hypothetical protein [Chroococcidiopsis sp. CCMEE 29]|uniref:hypothetical protein n=1 Tax=Chroococcidiopsis sp. CCMEE 29 TaxID=155894 RepID=UPI002022902D|nr:hypothetical protein [Chroococcidiopsis sp. CCMEE 29]
MKLLSSSLLFVGSLGLVFLGACSNGTQVTNPKNNSAASPSETASETTSQPSKNQGNQVSATGHSNENQGGQVIESGKYHLELIALPESNGTHLDFYLQEGANHKAIPNAKVTAEVQSPTGSQKTLNLTYDAAGKHYAALLPEQTPGEYKVVVLSEINGEKVNGRFTFKR